MLPKRHRFDRLVESVKEKIISSRQEKIKRLTLVTS